MRAPKPTEAARELRELTESAHAVGEPSTANLEALVNGWIDTHYGPLDPDHRAELLWLIAGAAQNLRNQLETLEGAIKAIRTRDIIEHGAIRLADQGWSISPKSNRKLLVPVSDFLAFVRERGWPEEDVFSLSEREIRITGFRDLIARDHYQANPDATAEEAEAAVKAAEATFFELVLAGTDGWDLKSVPIDKARWAEALEHRQRRPRKQPREEA